MKAAIVGGGVIGCGWAARFLLNGWDVAVFDPDPAARARVAAVLERARVSLPMLYDRSLPGEGRLSFAGSLAEAVGGADWVQECAPEDAGLKRRILAGVEAANLSAVVASSSLRVTPEEMRQGLPTGGRVLGVRAADPVWLLSLVEVRGETGVLPWAAARAREVLAALGMAPGEGAALAALAGQAGDAARDRVLVAVLRALKREGEGAGRVLAAHEARLGGPDLEARPMISVARVVPSDWTDYNGHMNEGRYGQVFSDAADAVLEHIGAGPAYAATGLSFFTVSTEVAYMAETLAGEAVRVETRVLLAEGRKLRLAHEMRRAGGGGLLATCDQFLLHVDLETRRSCPPGAEMARRMAALAG